MACAVGMNAVESYAAAASGSPATTMTSIASCCPTLAAVRWRTGGLGADCVAHARMFFNRPDYDLASARPPSFAVTPLGDMADALRRDYEAMAAMIFGPVPPIRSGARQRGYAGEVAEHARRGERGRLMCGAATNVPQPIARRSPCPLSRSPNESYRSVHSLGSYRLSSR